MTTVGAFTYDGTTLTGPAAYMAEQGDAKVEAILAGTDVVFNYGMQSGASPDPITAFLVALQTDYAGWKGSRDFFAAHGIGE